MKDRFLIYIIIFINKNSTNPLYIKPFSSYRIFDLLNIFQLNLGEDTTKYDLQNNYSIAFISLIFRSLQIQYLDEVYSFLRIKT